MHKLTWKEIKTLVEKVADRIESSHLQFKYIHGVSRGGLVPAVLLSHRLKVPLTTKLQGHKEVLIVDDMAETGATLRKYRNPLQAVLICRKQALSKEINSSIPFIGKVVGNTVKVIFPWENV